MSPRPRSLPSATTNTSRCGARACLSARRWADLPQDANPASRRPGSLFRRDGLRPRYEASCLVHDRHQIAGPPVVELPGAVDQVVDGLTDVVPVGRAEHGERVEGVALARERGSWGTGV